MEASSHRNSSRGHRYNSRKKSPLGMKCLPHHRHKSRDRRRHRSRSRSPESMGKRVPVVYMNPAFQPSYSNSLFLHSETELRSALVSQLSASEQRIGSLESELKAAQLARGRAEQTVFEVNAEKLRLESHNTEVIQVMRTLERGVEELQSLCSQFKVELENRKRELDNAEKGLLQCKEQNASLSERNMKLVRKCEELSEANKAMHSRRDESSRELLEMHNRLEVCQSELRQRAEECRKMLAQMRSYDEKERLWKKERIDFEKRIEIKDAMATAERRNNDVWKKRHLAEKAELERKVQLISPEIAKTLDAETIRKAIEDMKRLYDEKINILSRDLEKLRSDRSPMSLQQNSTVNNNTHNNLYNFANATHFGCCKRLRRASSVS